MTDDAELLHRYAETHAEDAFAEFVGRHINLVYAAAVRRLQGDTHGAADITQQVFVAAAQRASNLARHPRLTAWLHAATRNAATNLMRNEHRRREREREAHQTGELMAAPNAADWEQLHPLLDAAIDALGESDREAVLLRFFENRPFSEIAPRLRLTENAARMRVDRALDKLHALLGRRGISSTSTALGMVLAKHAAAAIQAPAGLAASVTSVAVAGTTGAMIAGLLGFMNITKWTSALAAASLIGIAVFRVYEHREAERVLAKTQSMHRERLGILRAAKSAAESAELELAGSRKRAGEVRTSQSGIPPAAQARPLDEGAAFLARHPEVTTALDDFSAAKFRFQYAPIIRELNLTSIQVEQLMSLWSRGAMGAEIASGKSVSLRYGREIPEDERTSGMRDVLGDSGLQRLYQYSLQVPGRRLATDVASALYFTETPLRPDQAEKLVAIAAESRLPRSAWHDWDKLMAKSQGVLSAPQLEVLAGIRATEQFSQVLTRATERESPKAARK
jgi:RNA polymerase sigma factor (sigma-70 family)